MRGVIDINEQQYQRIVDKIAGAAGVETGGRLDHLTVGVLGLTFKAGTDDLRESPSLRVINELRERGAEVRAFDPTTTGELSPVQQARLDGIECCSTLLDAASGADVVAVLTEWPEFAQLDHDKLAHVMRGAAVVDGRNLFDPDAVRAAGLRYDGVGRS
jgi:UDPglucose 6-dehydrogenase